MSALEGILDQLTAGGNGNPIESFALLAPVFTKQHAYLEQWRRIDVSISFVEQLVSIVQRYEANGLQLKGRGVNVLAAIFQHNVSPLLISDSAQQTLVEVVLRIAIEHPMIHLSCLEVLQHVVDKMNTSRSAVFEIGRFLD